LFRILIFLRTACLEEGLFRIPGNTLKINELKKIADKGRCPLNTSFTKNPTDGKVDLYKHKDVDSHTAGGLLKLYLRELPVPIIIPRFV
jgi:RhoGAP domain